MEVLALFHRHGDATKLGGLVSLFAVSADSFCARLLRDTLELGGVFAISAAARTMQSVLCTIIAGQDATVATVVPSRPAFHIAARGKVKAHISVEPLENINDIFERMEHGKIDGRIVIDLAL